MDLFVPYLLFQIFVGSCVLILTGSGEVFGNIFIPQMGVWYLLTLFNYRLVLPEISRVRGILLIGVFLTVFTSLCSFGGEFAIKKALGFFVYFMAGFKMDKLPWNTVPKVVARVCLLGICSVFLFLSWKTNWYRTMLAVLTRSATVETFVQWYIAPMVYFGVFLITLVVMLLVINALPEKVAWLEKQGADTMPMYLSHLVLFMAVGYLVSKDNWVLTVGMSVSFTLISLWVFSREWYRKVFNQVLKSVDNLFFRQKV